MAGLNPGTSLTFRPYLRVIYFFWAFVEFLYFLLHTWLNFYRLWSQIYVLTLEVEARLKGKIERCLLRTAYQYVCEV